MDTRISAEYDPQQVALFLDKIAEDCDAELREIALNRDAEIARIRGEAHAESRSLLRHGAGQLRSRLELERSRYLARVRSDLRRQQWEILVESQQRVLEAVSNRFYKAWENPDRQRQWCQYWLRAALERVGDSRFGIVLGRGASENVRARIEKEIGDHPAGGSVIIDANADPGIRIEWGDYVMDGRLTSQSTAITDAVLSRLADMLHEQDKESPP